MSTKTQETIFCIPQINTVEPPATPPVELPEGAQGVVATGAPSEYYLFPSWVDATRILAVEKSEPFELTAERLRGAVRAATRIQAAARRRIAIPGPTWWPRHSWPESWPEPGA